MINRAFIRSSLYSRQQVARLTGLDDSTLNYWMREGVLQAAEGGMGKGQHRRFAYHQINLALLLNQLRGFGVSLPALKRLAFRFHDALADYQHAGITRENDDIVDTIIRIRQEVAEQGFYEDTVSEEDLAKYIELFPWFATKKIYRSHSHLRYRCQLSLEEAIEVRRLVHLVYDREPDPDWTITDDVLSIAMGVDITAWAASRPYWQAITYLAPDWQVEVNEHYYTPLIVYRNSSGEWEVAKGDPEASMLSYVGIYLEKLGEEAWAQLADGDRA